MTPPEALLTAVTVSRPDAPVAAVPSPSARAGRQSWTPQDIVDEWGVQSFPASDPPANW